MASGKTTKKPTQPSVLLGKHHLTALSTKRRSSKPERFKRPANIDHVKVLKQRTRKRIAEKSDLEGYKNLVGQLPLLPIRSDRDLDRAIAMVDALLDRDDLDAGEQDYLDVLSDLVERYEDKTDPPRDVSDSEMLRFLMEQQAVTQVELSRATGIVESTISAVLSGKRTLNRSQIGKLANYFHVSPGVFAFDD